MEEETTTNAPVDSGVTIQGVPVDDQGQAITQPEPTDPAAAESTTEEAQASENQATTPEEPSEDEQLTSWAQNKGLELDSENAKKAAKMAYNAEKLMHKKTVQASELERTIGTASDEAVEEAASQTGQDPELLKRVQRVEVRAAVRDFWDTMPEAKEYEPQMIEELKTRPYLAGDLEALYAVVRSKDTSAVKRNVLTDLAHKQTAAVPTGNATNAQSMSGNERITSQNVDRLVGEHDLAWFQANQTAINAAMQG